MHSSICYIFFSSACLRFDVLTAVRYSGLSPKTEAKILPETSVPHEIQVSKATVGILRVLLLVKSVIATDGDPTRVRIGL